VGAGAQQVGSQQVGWQQVGWQQQFRRWCMRLMNFCRQQGFLQQQGSQQVGAGAQQVGAGAQQVGAGAQHVGSQQAGLQHLLRWQNALASWTLTMAKMANTNRADKILRCMREPPKTGSNNGQDIPIISIG